MPQIDQDISLTGGPPITLKSTQKAGTFLGLMGLFILLLASFNVDFPNKEIWLALSLSSIAIGITLYAKGLYGSKPASIKNDSLWFNSISSRGTFGWMAGIFLTSFYVVLYFFPQFLGLNNEGENGGLISLFDPLSRLLSGNPASQWFVYGTLYTVAIVFFGIKFIWKYRHNAYQRIRTISVMFFQTAFAFLIPEFMARLNDAEGFNLPYYDLKSIWPLNYYVFDQWSVDGLISSGTLGLSMLLFSVLSILVITPILTYKYGKRWYCSWVCGCGGLAETAGDSFRQLSDKSVFAWKVERWVIHSVLVFSVVMTTAVISTYLGYDSNKYWLTKDVFLLIVGGILSLVYLLIMLFKRADLKKDAVIGASGYLIIIFSLVAIHYFSGKRLFLFDAGELRSTYGFLIGSVFSGVIGTGFYPIFGNRVWCRFGCPMAAILGLQQRFFSKFRITTNGGQCISCGNCSTYCEMGIDVKFYAQKGQNIVRSSCVGCGICSAVCPRGVLKLENGADHGASRYAENPITFGNDGIKLNV
ncbi:MAG: FeS-binding protein [Verrucomicrobia bacterium]|nr:FeS-binding protein [Verrucomicrobiota bacterium]|tara:strand:+ start:842 stop:2428 length:1587 start_codon:yes stop_codon:yes gene_type:complete